MSESNFTLMVQKKNNSELEINEYFEEKKTLSLLVQYIDYATKLEAITEGLNSDFDLPIALDIQIKKKNFGKIFLKDTYSYKTVDSYYTDEVIFNGTVESIDYEKNSFYAKLAKDNRDVFSAEFSIGDIQYKSDKELLDIGAQFFFITGKEISILKKGDKYVDGPLSSVSRIIFRRTKGLNPKRIKEADNTAYEWTKFFSEL